jgi:hypothetical protein
VPLRIRQEVQEMLLRGLPIVNASQTTAALHANRRGNETFVRSDESPPTFAAPIAYIAIPDADKANSATLEVWEGTVLTLDCETGVIQVLLEATIQQMPRHTAEIRLDTVSAQDQHLMRPGAVFYLTLYKRTMPSIEILHDLRFRRRPSWTAAQLARVEQDATTVLSKMRGLPTAS